MAEPRARRHWRKVIATTALLCSLRNGPPGREFSNDFSRYKTTLQKEECRNHYLVVGWYDSTRNMVGLSAVYRGRCKNVMIFALSVFRWKILGSTKCRPAGRRESENQVPPAPDFPFRLSLQPPKAPVNFQHPPPMWLPH